jgi:hypothetical protein
VENNYPLLPFLPIYSDVTKISAMNISQTMKRYFASPCPNILMMGQLNRISPRTKRNKEMSLTIEEYYNKIKKLIHPPGICILSLSKIIII